MRMLRVDNQPLAPPPHRISVPLPLTLSELLFTGVNIVTALLLVVIKEYHRQTYKQKGKQTHKQTGKQTLLGLLQVTRNTKLLFSTVRSSHFFANSLVPVFSITLSLPSH